ncbi:MAG: hypothetical protein GX038_06440 [Erysipelothrix sp.]|nr:hypothetical protein [Erysipelothrix sp.]
MGILQAIIILTIIILILSVLFKIFWYFLPILLLVYGISYVINRVNGTGSSFYRSDRDTRSTKARPPRQSADIVDVEFTVKDDEDDR